MAPNPANPFKTPSWWGVLIALLLLLNLLTVVGSWLLSALGADIPNLLSPEGVRWLFRLHLSVSVLVRAECLLTLVVVAGAFYCSGLWGGLATQLGQWLACRRKVEAPRLLSLRQRRALWLSALTVVLGFGILFLSVGLTSSPLRSATGHVWPSPFLHGLLFSLALILIVACAVYGGTSRHLRTFSEFAALLYHGLQRFAPLLVVWYLAELLLSMLLVLS